MLQCDKKRICSLLTFKCKVQLSALRTSKKEIIFITVGFKTHVSKQRSINVFYFLRKSLNVSAIDKKPPQKCENLYLKIDKKKLFSSKSEILGLCMHLHLHLTIFFSTLAHTADITIVCATECVKFFDSIE